MNQSVAHQSNNVGYLGFDHNVLSAGLQWPVEFRAFYFYYLIEAE